MESNHSKNKRCSRCKHSKPFGDFPSGKNWRGWCKNCFNEWNKAYYRRNKEKVLAYGKLYAKTLAGKQARKRYTDKTKKKRRLYKRKWDQKYLENPVNRLSNNMRANMYHALKAKKGFCKWESLVGYSLDTLYKHLEGKFSNDMTWENYGAVWQVDHIIPKSWFVYNNPTDKGFQECWKLSNLQPKLKLDNIRKGNRFAG